MPDQHRVSLPVHAPIARHRLPYAAIAALELHGSDISFAPDVGDEHQVEVLVAIDREANASILHAWHPSEENWDDASFPVCDAREHRLRQVEMPQGRVAPAAVVVGQSVVGRTEVGGRDRHFGSAWEAMLGAVAHDGIASSTLGTVVEKHAAQRCRLCAIALPIQVPVAASSPHGA